jgi:cell wall assembly regulator SMI1
MVEQAVAAIAEALVAKAPREWTHVVMHARAGGGGSSVSGGYEPDPGGWHCLPNCHRALTAVAEELRGERGWESVSLEMRCEASGDYRLVVFDGTVSRDGDGYQVVLDPEHRLSQPGLRQEGSTSAPAGDPDLAVSRFRALLDRRAAILGRPEELPPPAGEAAVAETERRLGRRLPADLRALYALADGDGDRGLFNGDAWLPVAAIAQEHTPWGPSERPWFGWDLEWDAVVFDAAPAETVRRCGGHPGWLRFATRYDGNFLAVDTVPARNGRPGQVIVTGRDYDDGPAHLAGSVTELLGHHLELLDQGRWEKDGEDIQLLPARGATDTTHLIGKGIPEEVPGTLQAIHINDAGLVDLAPLAAAPGLRRLHLNRCATADLSPVRELPVESLRVVLDGDGDLTPLEGHGHLASLELATTGPVTLAPLRGLPRLHGIDLSAADVTEPAVLRDLPELRYLALTPGQWARLSAQGQVPAGLAAARLAAPDAGLDDALAWAARLGVDTRSPLRITGAVAA